MADLKTQIVVGADSSGVAAGLEPGKAALKGFAQSASAAGKEAGGSLDSIGDKASTSGQKVDNAAKTMIGSIQRLSAATEAGDKTSRQYYESIAKLRGVDANTLKPYLDQLDAVKAKQVAAINSASGFNGAMTTVKGSVDSAKSSLLGFATAQAAITEGEKARASLFERTQNETARLLGITRDAAASTAKSLADLKINPDAFAVPNDAFQSLRTWQEKSAYAVGSVYANMKEAAMSAWETTKDFAQKQIIIWGVAAAVGISAAVLGAVYAAAKGISFAVGLLTGESYKSANIDGLIAANNEVKKLQELLPLTATGASALNQALKDQGTTADEYAASIDRVRGSVVMNGEELDRLGVKYKDNKGQLLSTKETLENAAGVLATYAQGWDRTQAAQAIGLGTEKQIAAALAVTAASVAIAKEKLIEYNLVIGEGSQEAVKKYEVAMKAFNLEANLTAQGFSRAIADNIMPALTMFAEFFKGGMSYVVNAFRYSIATITSLFFGLKTSVYIVLESVLGAFSAAGSVIGGVAGAMVKAVSGDFAGAAKSLADGWEGAKNRVNNVGTNIVAQARANSKAMALAWGADSLGANNAAAAIEKVQKAFVPKPAKTGGGGGGAAERVDPQIKAYEQLVASIREKISVNEEEIKVGRKLTESEKQVFDIQKLVEKGSISAKDATSAQTKALVEKFAATEKVLKEEAKLLKYIEEGDAAKLKSLLAGDESLKQMADQNKALSNEIEMIGLTDRAQFNLNQTRFDAITGRKQERLEMLQKLDIGREEQQQLKDEINLRKENAVFQAQKFDRTAESEKLSELQKQGAKFAADLESGITASLSKAFSSGKGFFKSLWEDIKNLFKTTTLKLLVNTVIGGAGMGGTLASAATSALGGGSSAGGIGGMLSSGKSIYDAISGGFASVGASTSAYLSNFAVSTAGQSMGLSTTIQAMGPVMEGALAPTMNVMTSAASSMASAAGSMATAGAGIAAGLALRSVIGGGYSVSKGYDTFQKVGVGVATLVGGPVLGAIAGAAAGAINRIFGMGAKQAGDSGLRGSLNVDSASSVENFSKWTQKGGLFRSDKSGTETSAVSGELQTYLNSSVAVMASTTRAYADSLGLTAEKITGYTKSINLSLTGLDEKAVQAAIDKVLAEFGDSLAGAVLGESVKLAKAGETAGATLVRLGSSLVAVNSTFAMLGKSLMSADIAGAAVSSQLLDVFGGVEKFAAATDAYYQGFYRDEEKRLQTIKTINAATAGSGLDAATATRESFRALVNGQEVTTEAGQKTYASLLSVAGALSGILPPFEAAKDAVESVADAYVRLTTVLKTNEQIAQERVGLEAELSTLTDTAAQALTRQRDALDESNRALFDRIEGIKKENSISAQRIGLQDQINALTDTATEALTRQRNALDKSNQGLFDQVKALEAKNSFSANVGSTIAKLKTPEQNTADMYRGIANRAQVAGFLTGDITTIAENLTKSTKEQILAGATSIYEGLGVGAFAAKEELRVLVDMLADLKNAAPAVAAVVPEIVAVVAAIESIADAYARLTSVLKTNEQIAQEQISLEQRSIAATDNTEQAAARVRNAIDPLNRVLYDSVLAAEKAKTILQERAGLQEQLTALTETAAQALDRQRAALNTYNQDLFDQARAYAVVKKNDEERAGLQAQLNGLTDTATEALTRQRNALAITNRDLFDSIQLQTKANATAAEGKTLQDQLNGLADTAAQALGRQRDALDESNRTLFDQIQLQTRANAVEAEKKTLQERLVAATEDTAQAATRARNAVDPLNQALYDTALAAEKALAQTNIGKGLNRQLLEVQENTAALRLLDIEGMNASNVALYDRIAALKGEKVATETAKQNAAKGASDAMSALQRAVDAQRKIVQVARDAAAESVTEITSVFDILKSSIKELYGSVDSTAKMQADQGRAFITQALATAQSTGYLPESEALTDAINAAKGGTAEFASQFEKDFAALTLAGDLSILETLSKNQLTEAQKALKNQDDQLRALDDVLSLAQKQLDAANGINTSVLSVADAVAQLALALNVVKATGGGALGGGAAIGKSVAQSDYEASIGMNSDLSGTPRSDGKYTFENGILYNPSGESSQSIGSLSNTDALAVFQQMFGAGNVLNIGSSSESLPQKYIDYINDARASIGYGPAFASGINRVPFDMTARIHEGEAVVPAAFNPFNPNAKQNGMGGNTERLETLVEGLTAEVQRLQMIVNDGNTHQRRTADTLENVTEGGANMRTVAA